MIILGIDPGTLITGIGIIDVERGKSSLLMYDVIKNSSAESMPIRLKRIYNRLSEIIGQFHPDELAIETAFYGKNVQSALKIGHARGVSILAAVIHEIPTTEYSPREIKRAVTGSGAASKQQVQFMIQKQLKLPEAPKYFDASDALAVALCHSFRRANEVAQFTHYGKRKSGSSHRWSEYIHAHPERIVRKK